MATHAEAVIKPEVSEGIPATAWATWGVILLAVVIFWYAGAFRKRQKAQQKRTPPW